MIVVKLELWPLGNPSATSEIGRIKIETVNDDVEPFGDYLFSFDSAGQQTQVGNVYGHKRRSGAWWLVLKVLMTALGAELEDT